MSPKREDKPVKPEPVKAKKPREHKVKRPDLKINQMNSHQEFPVAALGASAGGLEAFTRFLNKVPPDSGIAFIAIQHLDPAHTSKLPELLSRQSHVPVLEATDGMNVEPNHVYIIPPGKNMSIRNRTLALAAAGVLPR